MDMSGLWYNVSDDPGPQTQGTRPLCMKCPLFELQKLVTLVTLVKRALFQTRKISIDVLNISQHNFLQQW